MRLSQILHQSSHLGRLYQANPIIGAISALPYLFTPNATLLAA